MLGLLAVRLRGGLRGGKGPQLNPYRCWISGPLRRVPEFSPGRLIFLFFFFNSRGALDSGAETLSKIPTSGTSKTDGIEETGEDPGQAGEGVATSNQLLAQR